MPDQLHAEKNGVHKLLLYVKKMVKDPDLRSGDPMDKMG